MSPARHTHSPTPLLSIFFIIIITLVIIIIQYCIYFVFTGEGKILSLQNAWRVPEFLLQLLINLIAVIALHIRTPAHDVYAFALITADNDQTLHWGFKDALLGKPTFFGERFFISLSSFSPYVDTGSTVKGVTSHIDTLESTSFFQNIAKTRIHYILILRWSVSCCLLLYGVLSGTSNVLSAW